MTIDALPTAPNRNMTPEAFIAAADAFVASLATMVSQVNNDLSLILNTAGLVATSTTSLTVGTGSKALTVQTDKTFLATMSVRVYDTATPANWMTGTVTSYDATTGALVVNVTATNGSGTVAAWTVALQAAGEWVGNAATATLATTATTATTASDGFGISQTWQSFTSIERAPSTLYTNNTDRPIEVHVSYYNTGAFGLIMTLIIDSIGIEQFQSNNTSTQQTITLKATVPPGSTYQFTHTFGTFNGWFELR